jgi:ATP-dependent DNA helicase RecQ
MEQNDKEIHSILHTTFGLSEFRGNQMKIIKSVLLKKDSLILMPTGGGKSLCYQLPALSFHGITIVLSPLIALMKDQVDALTDKGIEAAFLNSSLTLAEQREIELRLTSGHIKLLYISPERLMLQRFQNVLKKCEVSLIAIDEAHCVSQWGHDFRPEYMELGILSDLFPDSPIIALTATAGEATRKDIIDSLRLRDPDIFISSFDRPNIEYSIQKKTKKPENYKKLLNFINDNYPKDSGIVYCLSRKKTEDTAKFLKQNGIKAWAYHAGMPTKKREQIQERFLKKKNTIIVATIAFGMGIDKPDVRFVAHMDLPKCPESYYQETGRAGRDGLPSKAWMLYGMQEVVMLKRMMNKGNISFKRKQVNEEKLDAMIGLCETTECRRSVLLNYFNDPYAGPCLNCDTCHDPVDTKVDRTEEAILALKCVHETKQNHDIHYMINVLTGFATGIVQGNNHHNLPVFNKGNGIKDEIWYSIYRQLIAGGMIKMKMDGTSKLELTHKALPVINGELKVYLRFQVSKKVNPSKPVNLNINISSKDEPDIYEALKLLRATLAKKSRTKAYKVFSDQTLTELADLKPTTPAELENIYGIGPKKLKKYGQTLIEFITQYS